MAKPKDLLASLLKTGKLTSKEREAFEGMWDQLHRAGKLSNKQKAWIESVHYKQELDRPRPISGKPKRKPPKVLFLRDENATRVLCVTSMVEFEVICKHIKKDSPRWKVVHDFFRDGGQLFELRPKL